MGTRETESLLEEGARTTAPGDQKVGYVPLLQEDLAIDDQDATVILVFPRGSGVGGSVDVTTTIHNPVEQAKKIFVRPQNANTHKAWEDNFKVFGTGPVTAKVYQDVCRNVLLQICENSGFQVSSFKSIDGDEVFLKIALDRNGQVIKQLAQRFQYRVPFSFESYSDMPPSGTYEGGKPMENRNGRQVPAYAAYEYEIDKYVQPFREVDEIRIILRRLDEWVSMAELLSQGIISKYFPGVKHEKMIELHEKWGTLRNWWHLPKGENDDLVRDYFGEEITFFFRWFCFYAQMLAPLGLLGLLTFAVKWAVDNLDIHPSNLPHFAANARYLQVAFAFVLVGWASVYNEFFKNRDARATQRWGMEDCDATALERAEYRSDLEGTWRLWLQRELATFLVVGCCVGFVFAVGATEAWKRQGLESGDDLVEAYGAYTTVILIKVVSALWSKVAPFLADIQNHRTQLRWNDSLTKILTSVKLFVALYPFVNLTFLKKYMAPTCKATLYEAARKIYSKRGWPTNIVMSDHIPDPTNETDVSSTLGWLSGYFYESFNGTATRYCVYGCYPVTCSSPEGGAHNCETNCESALQEELLLVYITHVICTMLFLLIPILLTRRQIGQEIAKIQTKGEEGSAPKRLYSLLQFQAKCHDQAPYQYASWGGSQVEDFLELAVGFALLTCFGILVPVMSLLAFLAHVVEYRLLAYRMTNVTCRPIPHVAAGIGSWQTIFETISFIAVAINVGIAVFVLKPMTYWGPWKQLAAFIILEHAMLLLKSTLAGAIPDQPEDVQRIDDFNQRFTAKFVNRPKIDVPENERCPVKDVDISLGE